MKLRTIALATCLAAVGVTAFAQAKEQFFPGLPYRTGPYAPNGVPWANGYADYLKLVNAQGGINGVKIIYEECETGYDTARGVECYERLKSKPGVSLFDPQATDSAKVNIARVAEHYLALAETPIPLEATLACVPCRGGESLLRALFEPLGYAVTCERIHLDDSERTVQVTGPNNLGAHHGPWSLGTRVSQTVLVDRLPPGCALGPGCPVAPDRFRYFIEELP